MACSDPLTQRWLPLPRPYTEESARGFVTEWAPQAAASGRALERGIEVDGDFVGVIGLKNTDWAVARTEAGYWLGPWARGRGSMARALSALADWALDSQGIDRIEVLIAPDNHGSLTTARRALFIEEGRLRHAGHTHEGPVDLVVLSRLADDPRPRFDDLI
ncbi:GNAT family N-acetyltransferase [Luteococcus peritonei]